MTSSIYCCSCNQYIGIKQEHLSPSYTFPLPHPVATDRYIHDVYPVYHLPKSISADVSFEVPVSLDKYPSTRSNTHILAHFVNRLYFTDGWVSKWIGLQGLIPTAKNLPFLVGAQKPSTSGAKTLVIYIGKFGNRLLMNHDMLITNSSPVQSFYLAQAPRFFSPRPDTSLLHLFPIPSSGSSTSIGGFQLSMVQSSLMRWVPGIIRLEATRWKDNPKKAALGGYWNVGFRRMMIPCFSQKKNHVSK